MKSAIQIIIDNKEEYPELISYLPLMKKAERNLAEQPDITIEICKALLEGVSKSIILRFDNSTVQKNLDKENNVQGLVKRAAKHLAAYDNVIEDAFITRMGSFAQLMGELRNERGDISHGRAYPKHKASEDRLAQAALSMTESTLVYMLDGYVRGPETPVDVAVEEVPLDHEIPDSLYEESPEFNDYLDKRYPLDGKIIYSEALFSLYREEYQIQLSDYSDGLGDESE